MNKLGLIILCLVLGTHVFAKTEVSGELKKWHKVTLTFDGPEVSETDKYNPFMNYRLNVTFTHPKSGKRYVVPGYLAADGNAGETSAIKGNKWRVHFAPQSSWATRLKSLLGKHPNIPQRSMGFLENWEAHPIWNLENISVPELPENALQTSAPAEEEKA